MFYDSKIKVYKFTNASGESEEFTKQDLFEFYIMSGHDYQGSFEDLVYHLDTHEEITLKDMEYDWGIGTYIFKGMSSLRKLKTTPKTPKNLDNGCSHENKYVVQHFNGGVRYWVCPKCKADLGDA